MAPIHLQIGFVDSVVPLGSPTNPQMLTALTENSTSVDGARSSNTYISSIVFFIVGIPSTVNWTKYCSTTPLSLDGAFHEIVMSVKVVTAMLRTTCPGATVGKTNLVYMYMNSLHNSIKPYHFR